MKGLLITGGVILGYVLWRCCRARFATHDQPVSDQWLADQKRADDQIGIDSVAWDWPVRKLVNEAGEFNRHRARKRA